MHLTLEFVGLWIGSWELKMETIRASYSPSETVGEGERAQKTYYFPIDLNFNDVFIRLHART